MTSFRLVTISAAFSAVLAWVLLLSSPAAPVHGDYDTITILPGVPSEEDFVRIGIEGSYYVGDSSGCASYYYPESASYSISGQTIEIQATWGYYPGGGGGGGQCNADWLESWYVFWFDIGPLAAGDYTVEADSGPGFPNYSYIYALASFTVTPDNCPSVPNPEQADANGNGVGDACDPADSDGDGFSDRVEYFAGTSLTLGCGVNAWPADINDDGSVGVIDDLATVAGDAFESAPPAPARHDIAPDPPNGTIGVIDDLARIAGLAFQSCTP